MRFALRSESLTFFSLLVVASVVYSAYVVYRGVTGELGGMGTQHATVMTLMQGGSEIVALNVTVPNKGLYTLQVSVSCPQGTSSNIVCDPGSVTVPAGQQRVLHFQMTITDPRSTLPRATCESTAPSA